MEKERLMREKMTLAAKAMKSVATSFRVIHRICDPSQV